MTKEEFTKITANIQEKLGDENSSKITDDLSTLIVDNETVNQALEDKDKVIEQLRKDKENLISVNANLFQQVAVGKEKIENDNDNEDKKIDMKSIFDEKGNFKM